MIMTKLSSLLSLLALSPLLISAHTTHDEETNDAAAAAAEADAWYSKYGQTGDLSFTGITSFAHLPHIRCLDNPSAELDVAIVGMPFDSAVSFRPGARFGPYGIRSGVFVLGIRIEPGGVFHTDFPPLL
jgi:agmatinase